MFGSNVLEVAIGLSLFFLVVSLICSVTREAIEGVLKTRAQNLERGLRELLDDPSGETLMTSVMQHGSVASLFGGQYDPRQLARTGRTLVTRPLALVSNWRARRRLPSYIPTGHFATALMDIVSRGPGNWPYPVASAPMTIEQLRQQAAYLPSGKVQRAVLSAIDFGQNDLEKVKANLEAWFDGSMDRVSGWYKRRTQLWLFVLGLISAVLLNLDALAVAKRLNDDKMLRDAFVAQAAKVQDQGLDNQADTVPELRAQLADLGAPIGWVNNCPGPQTSAIKVAAAPEAKAATVAGAQTVPQKGTEGLGARLKALADCSGDSDAFDYWIPILFGWLITAGAVTFGAPFWFDLLNKFMVIRSTVKPREKSQEEGSEDRKAAKAAAPGHVAPPPPPPAPPVAPPPPPTVPPPPPVATSPAPRLAPQEAAFDGEQWQDGFANPGEVAV